VNFFVEFTLAIMNGSIGEGGASNILHTMLRVPCTIEIVYLKAPFLLVLQFIHYLLESSTKRAMRGEILYDLESTLIV
jgi:hypothetical protein